MLTIESIVTDSVSFGLSSDEMNPMKTFRRSGKTDGLKPGRNRKISRGQVGAYGLNESNSITWIVFSS